MRRKFLYCLVATLCAQPAAHAAWRFDYDLELGLRHSDNITLSELDPVSENILIPRAAFSISETGSSIQTEVTGVVEYLDYLGGTYGSELRGELDASVNWVLSPQRFAWTFSDYLGMEPINRRDPSTPDNSQRVNVFTTGPTLRMLFAPTLTGEAQLRYTDTYAETSRTFDSGRISGMFRTDWQMSPTRSLSGNFEAQEIDFDNDDISRDYKRYSVYAGYAQEFSELAVRLMAGRTRIEFRDGEGASGPLFNATMDWRMRPGHRALVSYTRGYSDAAAYFARNPDPIFEDAMVGGEGIGGIMVSPDVYRERRVEAAYRYTGTRLSASVSAGTAQYDYLNVTTTYAQDRKEQNGFADISYRLNGTSTIGANLGIIRTEYTVIQDREELRLLGGYFEQQLSRHWNWRVDLARTDRSAEGALPTYRENSVYARLIYSRN